MRVGRRTRSASMKYITPGYWDANSHVSSKLRNVSSVLARISPKRPSLRPASGCRAPFRRPGAKDGDRMSERQKILKDVKAAVKTGPEACLKSDEGGGGCPYGPEGHRSGNLWAGMGTVGGAPILRWTSENDQSKYFFASVLP